MLQGLAQQLAARGGGQGGGLGGGVPQQGGVPAGNTGVVPPWLAQIRGGNPLGGMLGGGGAQGGGFNPLAALQARLGGLGGQGAGGFQLPPWLAGARGGTPIIPQGGPAAFAAPGVGQGGGVTAQAPAATGLQAATGIRSLPQSWNPAGWGSTSGNIGLAQDLMHQNTPTAGAQPATGAGGGAAPAASSAWNPASWGAGKADAQSLMHQNMATASAPKDESGLVQGAKQPTVPGASQRVRRSY